MEPSGCGFPYHTCLLCLHQDLCGALLARRALAAAEGEPANTINSVVWALHEGPLRLTEAAALAAQACERSPDDDYLRQTLAAVLGRSGRWDEAEAHLTHWAARTSGDRLIDGWRDFVSMFQDAVRQGRADALARALRPAPGSYPWPEVLAALCLGIGDAWPRPRPGDALVAELAEQMHADRRFDFPAVGSASYDGASAATDALSSPRIG